MSSNSKDTQRISSETFDVAKLFINWYSYYNINNIFIAFISTYDDNSNGGLLQLY